VLARRQVLDRYGAYGQVSVLLAVLVYLVCHLDIRVPSQSTKIGKGYAALPRKHVASSTSLRQLWRAFSWWLGGEARPGWGSRGHLIAGTAWLLWLLFLCIHHTTDGMYPPILTEPIHLGLLDHARGMPGWASCQASSRRVSPFSVLLATSGYVEYSLELKMVFTMTGLIRKQSIGQHVWLVTH
jgi:hypothetical protein